MLVAMMKIRVVRMCVGQLIMAMGVSMRFPGRIIRGVGMLMMFIVPVRMLMSHRLVMMLVRMAFGQMQPNPYHHETAGKPEKNGRRLV